MQLFRLARAGVSMTPIERAALRFIQGILATGGIAAAQVAFAALAANGLAGVNYGSVLHTALGAFVAAVALAAHKYATAQGDAPLASLISGAESLATEHGFTAPNDVKKTVEPAAAAS